MISTLDLYNGYFKKTRRIQATVARVERLTKSGALLNSDLESTYEGLFLKSVVLFENFVEDLFSHLIAEAATHPRNAKAILNVRSTRVATTILTNGGYLDWLPLTKAEKLARTYFINGCNPLDVIERADRNEIEKVVIIRNVVAHWSDYALKRFTSDVYDLQTLPRYSRTLTGYFRSSHSAGVTKFEYHLGEMARVAQKIAT